MTGEGGEHDKMGFSVISSGITVILPSVLHRRSSDTTLIDSTYGT